MIASSSNGSSITRIRRSRMRVILEPMSYMLLINHPRPRYNNGRDITSNHVSRCESFLYYSENQHKL